MLHLALRNLLQSRMRLVVATGGVALALTLILTLDAILTGTERQITAWVDHSGADVIVSQEGVRTIHMSSSVLPSSVVDRVDAVPGVAEVTPILYISSNIAVGDEQSLAYIMGLPANPAMGMPWDVPEGSRLPEPGRAIIDRAVAEAAGAGLGDSVRILGSTFDIAGLSGGTTMLTNSVAFITVEDFARLRGDDTVVSYVLIRTQAGESAAAVAQRIEARVTGVTAQTREEFARQERRIVKDMSTDLVSIMNLAGFLIGLAVMALTVYTATFSRRREYGVLKALGIGNRRLYVAVLAQALLSVVLAFVAALAVTLLLTMTVPMASPRLSLAVSGASLARVVAVSVIIAGLASLLPIRQIAGLDPALVYRRGGP